MSANAIRHKAAGPRVVTAHTADQLQDVLNWASASAPELPTTCVDFVSEDTTHTVLVQLPGAPGMSLHKVKTHKLTDDGPMPDELAVKSEFDDSSEVASTSKADWRIFRLTLVSEFADASRFADARNRPQGLPGMMLSAALASKVVRTFAVAVYDTEVTCLIKVRTADAAIISQAKLLPGAFLQAQRDPDAHIVWFARREAETSDQYRARISSEVAKTAGHSLAYRPGGRANLGVRSASRLSSLEGSIAPRWMLSNAPQGWLNDEISAWLTSHPQGVYANGFVVAPASGNSSRKKKTCTTAGPVWGAGNSKSGTAVAKPAATPTAVSSQETATRNEADADAQDRSRSRSRGREAPKAGAQAPQASGASERPRVPHEAKFEGLECGVCGGAGDCAVTSIATAMARWANSGASQKDLAPGGKLQGFLRCEAAKFIRQQWAEFAHIGNPDSMAADVAKAGRWADSPALCALAGALRLQFRIWAFDSAQNV